MDKNFLNRQIILEYLRAPFSTLFYILFTIILPCSLKLIDLVELYISPEQHAKKIARLIQVITNEQNNSSSGDLLDASQTLGTMGGANRAIPQLTTLLNHSNSEVRTYAVKTLGYIGILAKNIVPQVLTLLKDPNSDVRYSAVQALGDMGELRSSDLPELFPLLQDSDSMVRMMAINILGYQEKFASLIIPQLIPLLKKSDVNTRFHTQVALQRLGYEETAS